MRSRPALLLLLLLLVTGSIAFAATALGQTSEGGEGGPVQPATPPADAKFVVNNADGILSGGANLTDLDKVHALPFSVDCEYDKGMYVWPAPCQLTVTAKTTKHVAKILRLSSSVLAHGVADLPKVPFGQQPTPNEPAEDSDYHLPVSAAVRKRLKPVGYIKYVDETGFVTGPRGEVVKLPAGSGDWGGRRTPGGIVCPSKDINLTIRPHNHPPYCPGGLGGTASPGWYKG